MRTGLETLALVGELPPLPLHCRPLDTSEAGVPLSGQGFEFLAALLLIVLVVHVSSWALLAWLAPLPVVLCLVAAALAFYRRTPAELALLAAGLAPVCALVALAAAVPAIGAVGGDLAVGLTMLTLPAASSLVLPLMQLFGRPPRSEAYAPVPAPTELGEVDLLVDARVGWEQQRPTIGLALLVHAPEAASTLLAHTRAGGPPGWSRHEARANTWFMQMARAEFSFGPWSPLWYAAEGARSAVHRLGIRDRTERSRRGDAALSPEALASARAAQEATAVLFLRQVWTAIDLARADADPPNLYALVPTDRLADTPAAEDLARAMGRPPAGGVGQATVQPTPPELEEAARIHTARLIEQSLLQERLTQMALGSRPISGPAR